MRATSDAKLSRMANRLLTDVSLFSRFVVGRTLRPYQLAPARAVMHSVRSRGGETISVMMSRQAGKNELSAHLEAYLLSLHQKVGGQIVKYAPTYVPQLAVSRLRLEWALENPLTHGVWRSGVNGLRLGRATIRFLSAEPCASVVGATASLLLEVDEAQDIDPEKHDRDLAPMATSTNATRVYYGTAWRADDLLQRVKEQNLAKEQRDGVQRHFECPWDVVAEQNPDYARYVLGERARLGDDHPLFKTQYRLQVLEGEANFLNAQQRALMRGDHARAHAPHDDAVYVAGVNLIGPGEQPIGDEDRRAHRCGDSTIVTIARAAPVEIADGVVEPRLEVVEQCWWGGSSHREQYPSLLATLRNVWGCQRVIVGASGTGACAAELLRRDLGDVAQPFVFTGESKSRLGFAFLAAVNGGRFRMYGNSAGESDEDGCAAEFWREAALCRYSVRRNQQLGFWVPTSEGHDDFLVSAALCAWAGRYHVVSPPAMIMERSVDLAGGRH